MKNGLLYLRDLNEAGEAHDLPILREWKSAKLMLSRYKLAAAGFLGGKTPELGKAWLETLPGQHGTPWTIEEDDYAQAHIRTRLALIGAPDAYSCSGLDRVLLSVGIVNVVEHRALHSEINLGTFPRTHLIVDVETPIAED